MSVNGNSVCGLGNPHGHSGSLPLECVQNCVACEIKRPNHPKQDPKPLPTGRHFRISFWDSLSKGMVLLGRIELPTSSLPMTRSTTELQQLTPKVRPYAKGLA